MPYAKRWQWLEQQTGADTTRGMAAACGVTHTTVQRWLSKGIPFRALTELMFRFQCDPVEAVVIWGHADPARAGELNWDALVQYVPLDVLLREVHRRELRYVSEWDDRLRRRLSPVATAPPIRLHA